MTVVHNDYHHSLSHAISTMIVRTPLDITSSCLKNVYNFYASTFAMYIMEYSSNHKLTPSWLNLWRCSWIPQPIHLGYPGVPCLWLVITTPLLSSPGFEIKKPEALELMARWRNGQGRYETKIWKKNHDIMVLVVVC